MREQRWALLAGGSGGVGRTLGRMLAEDGWSVALTYRSNQEAAEQAAKLVRDGGGEARCMPLDLTDAAAAEAVVAEVASWGPLITVVYAAGPALTLSYVAQISSDSFSSILDNDVKACFNLLRPALPYLRETSGRILAITTVAMNRYVECDVLSAAPKAAVRALVRAIAVEEGRHGITANCVSAGVCEGAGMWTALMEQGALTEEVLGPLREKTPLRRFGDVSDVAEAARFLLSDKARWITGQTLAVDGGFEV